MRAPRERRLLWGMVALILAVYAFLACVLFTYRTWPFDSDEVVHAIQGLQLAADLRGGQIGDFFSDLYFHRWYPPLLSLYLTPFLAILGPSYWAARYPLLLLFVLNLALLYRVGRLLWRRWEAGVVAVLLGATSPVMWMLALLCMEESLAMTGLLLVIAGCALSVRGKLNWLWVGLALVVTFLARISTGVFTSIALLVVCCARPGTLKERIRVTGQVLGPLAVTAFIWWIHPFKLQGLQDYFLASAPRQSSITWPLLTHYWEQLLSTHTAGWVLGLLVVVSIFSSLLRWKEPVVQLLLTLLLIAWGALVLKRQLAPRLFFVALPPAFLLTSLQIVTQSEKMGRWVRNVLIGSLTLYLLAATAIRALTFPFLMEVAYETDLQSEDARAWIAQHASAGKIFMINGWDQFSSQTQSWYLASLHWPHGEKDQVADVELQDPARRPEAVADFQQAVLAFPGSTIVHLGNTPVPQAGAWWAYQSSLVACWDGEWEATTTFWIKIWDGRLEGEILTHPIHFLRQKDREAARQSLWYSLLFEVHIATCNEMAE
jgi:4-amino-4-deoxy-L-arabinose transferase-like glycosyltransferase